MENTVETVKIEADNEQGFIVINKSDYDENAHTLHGEKPKRRTRTRKAK
jgi:hypothetical protein